MQTMTNTRTSARTNTRTRDLFISLVHLNLDATGENDMSEASSRGKTEDITISLGRPITVPVLVPVEHRSTPTCINEPFIVDGDCYKVTAMTFGTPHGAVFVDDLDSLDVAKVGSLLGNHALFPKGASIVFIQMIDRKNLKARVWQRGEGELLFTTEAACVAGTAAMMLQKTPWYEIDVSMGETFRVKWSRGDSDVTITGPAKYIDRQTMI